MYISPIWPNIAYISLVSLKKISLRPGLEGTKHAFKDVITATDWNYTNSRMQSGKLCNCKTMQAVKLDFALCTILHFVFLLLPPSEPSATCLAFCISPGFLTSSDTTLDWRGRNFMFCAHISEGQQTSLIHISVDHWFFEIGGFIKYCLIGEQKLHTSAL